MIPIHELLARIRWDPRFGRGHFELAYLDRRRIGLVRLPLDRVEPSKHARFAFEAIQDDGSAHTIPYHRVREVWRDGELIWMRHAPRPVAAARKPRPRAAAPTRFAYRSTSSPRR